MKKIILVKLGGSLISDKTRINKANFSKIKRLSKQIKELKKTYDLIIFTGAGGFGHPVAEKYKNNLKEGIKEIKNACKKLNKIVVSALVRIGLKAVSVEPDKVAKYYQGRLIELLDSYIVSLLKKNIIPVFHADLVEDKKLGMIILSMDKFLVDSAIYLKNKGQKIEKAIFLGATPVYDFGAEERTGRIIRKITKKSFLENKDIFFKTKGIDVSGGMKYKVEQCLRLADQGIKSYIANNLLGKGTLVISESAG